MKTKALVLGSLAALGILIGVALISSAAGAMDEGSILRAAEGTPALERVQKTMGALIRDRARLKDRSCSEGDPGEFGMQVSELAREQSKDGSCDEGEPENAQDRSREQSKDGSCDESEPENVQDRSRDQSKDGSCDEGEPGSSEEPYDQEEQDRSGTQIQDRDRDQTNGGNGAQNRNSGN
ncbi:MAG: hypothetical protein QCI82_06385 [Candidatus Thermoplasmatota archaeon]|nr:hypothetical protein [Candidatus Thermoplasmatota archaeon]